ncbi:unnamed protein product [Arabis nemorensis]|uniref:Cyclin-dependent kinase inhibitor domain-containing protein n=1 Tax=Arabis nemorensis TaxID=586526 RepID=A0A565BSJ8_9BRAS|nr:unnamed protein product [Arabis nemorensis]
MTQTPSATSSSGADVSRTRNPKAEKFESAMVTETVEDCGSNEGKYGSDCNFGEKGFDFESRDRFMLEREMILSLNVFVLQEKERNEVIEIEDFFAYAEQQQQRNFIEKYNFDTVSDNPLPGRYEWVKVEP